MPIPNYDNTLVGRYIRAIENPDSVGYKNGKWYKSSRKGDDSNNRGFGVDIKYNKRAAKTAKGRSGNWLTEQEERDLRNSHIQYTQNVLNKYTPTVLKNQPSEAKKAMALGMLYRGDGMKAILNTPSLRNAFYNGTDKDFQDAVSNYYKGKGLNERAVQHNAFMNNQNTKKQGQTNWFNPTGNFKSPFADGGQLDKPRKWDELTMSQKSDVMAAAVRNGITGLQDIRDKWNEFAEGGYMPDTVGEYSDAIYDNATEEPYGDPSPHYNNVNEELLQTLTPDARGHYDDIVKLPNHPSSPIRGTFNGNYFDLTDEGMANPNYTLFGLIDNGDADTTLRYHGDYVLPELTVTPQGNYYDDTYNNIRIKPNYAEGGHLFRGGGKKAQRNQTANYATNYFMKKGLSREAAAGLVGNLMRESQLDPYALNNDKYGGAHGIAQWRGARWKNLQKMYGKGAYDLDNQLDYVWHELNTTHKNGLKMLQSSKSVDDAARNAFGYYEFSAGPDAAIAAMNGNGKSKGYNQANGTLAMNTGINYAHAIYGSTPKGKPTIYQKSAFALPRNTQQDIDFLGMVPSTPINNNVFDTPLLGPVLNPTTTLLSELPPREETKADNTPAFMKEENDGNSILNTLIHDYFTEPEEDLAAVPQERGMFTVRPYGKGGNIFLTGGSTDVPPESTPDNDPDFYLKQSLTNGTLKVKKVADSSKGEVNLPPDDIAVPNVEFGTELNDDDRAILEEFGSEYPQDEMDRPIGDMLTNYNDATATANTTNEGLGRIFNQGADERNAWNRAHPYRAILNEGLTAAPGIAISAPLFGSAIGTTGFGKAVTAGISGDWMPLADYAARTVGATVGGIAGSTGVNAVSNATTGKSWGENVSKWTGIDPYVAEFTNPGGLIGGGYGYGVGNRASKMFKALNTKAIPASETYSSIADNLAFTDVTPYDDGRAFFLEGQPFDKNHWYNKNEMLVTNEGGPFIYRETANPTSTAMHINADHIYHVNYNPQIKGLEWGDYYDFSPHKHAAVEAYRLLKQLPKGSQLTNNEISITLPELAQRGTTNNKLRYIFNPFGLKKNIVEGYSTDIGEQFMKMASKNQGVIEPALNVRFNGTNSYGKSFPQVKNYFSKPVDYTDYYFKDMSLGNVLKWDFMYNPALGGVPAKRFGMFINPFTRTSNANVLITK